MQEAGMASAALGVGLLLGAGGVWVWQRAQLKELQARLLKTEQQRHQAQQFADKARKQIELLQHDLTELRQVAGPGVAKRFRPTAPPVEELEDPAADGFQKTQMMSPT
jgi:uncharacterized protein HemX